MLELLEDFDSETRTGLADVEKALKDKDPTSVGQHAHKIKGSAANLMCCGLKDACKNIEKWGLEYEHTGLGKNGVITKQAAELAKVKKQAILFTEMLKRRQQSSGK